MCNIAAAAGIGLLLLMGGRRGSKSEPAPTPVAPIPKTNYASEASDQAAINQGLASDASSGVGTSSDIKDGQAGSPTAGGGTRIDLPGISPNPKPPSTLPTIGARFKQKPVNY